MDLQVHGHAHVDQNMENILLLYKLMKKEKQKEK